MEEEDAAAIARLCGKNDENLEFLEKQLALRITRRGNFISVSGEKASLGLELLKGMLDLARAGSFLTSADFGYALSALQKGERESLAELFSSAICFTARGKPIRAKTKGQREYVRAMRENTIVFGIGPAGTGKTYLAACEAVREFKSHEVSRVVLVRPAVEAGESLGFLPGDLREKVEPYLRPLYDAFFDLLTPERFARLTEKKVIEIAPLAYMRGRTLNDSFIILDEAQNTTPEQMKMFLTRLGFGSKAVITGDLTQIDLPHSKRSGLRVASEILKDVSGVSFINFQNEDVVRAPIVQKIVAAYARYEA